MKLADYGADEMSKVFMSDRLPPCFSDAEKAMLSDNREVREREEWSDEARCELKLHDEMTSTRAIGNTTYNKTPSNVTNLSSFFAACFARRRPTGRSAPRLS